MRSFEKIGEGKYQDVFRVGNKILKISKEFVNPNILKRVRKYYEQIKSIGINVPDYFWSRINEDDKMESLWSYTGKPLQKEVLNLDEKGLASILYKIWRIGIKSYEDHVAFYPLLEQFTISKGRISFIDFFPPRTRQDFKEYSKKKRLELSLIFYGISQKIITPAREMIRFRDDLRSEILNSTKTFLRDNGLNALEDDFLKAICYEEVNEKQEDIVKLCPSKCIFTKSLLREDQQFLMEQKLFEV